MANYIGTGRSNYFKVIDGPTFEAWAQKIGLNIWKGEKEHEGCYAFSGDDEAGTTPCEVDVGTKEEAKTEETEFFTELAKHLADGQVATFTLAEY